VTNLYNKIVQEYTNFPIPVRHLKMRRETSSKLRTRKF